MAEQAPAKNPNGDQPPGGLIQKIFPKRADPEEAKKDKASAPQGVAHIPATALTVEYVDESEGMDAALKAIGERLQKLEEQLAAVKQVQGDLVAAINQQAKDIGKYIESIGRRVDQIYKKMGGSDTRTGKQPGWPQLPEVAAQASPQAEPAAPPAAEPAAPAGALPGLSPEVAGDPDHQNAWRIARVLAADLEAYYPDQVKEGVLYGTFYKILRGPIEKARATYEQRVSQEIVENYDYFSKALDELIARKRMELEKEEESDT